MFRTRGRWRKILLSSVPRILGGIEKGGIVPRLVKVVPSTSSVREAMVEKIRERRGRHEFWDEWVGHYDRLIARWESSQPVEVWGWELPAGFRLPANVRVVVDADGEIRRMSWRSPRTGGGGPRWSQ